MELVMCTSCGEFVFARFDDDVRRPVTDACPACGGTEFEDTHTGRRVRTD